MEELKLGKKSSDLRLLCELLGVPVRTTFDSDLDKVVRSYQVSKGLTSDGWVGYNTWKQLLLDNRKPGGNITLWDYDMFSHLLGVPCAALKAIQKVETGDKNGFTSPGHPQILFEGHIFWKELVKLGIDPTKYGNAWSGVLYKSWDRTKYKGGAAEWGRLETAKKINPGAAFKSASWGMYQIMGGNYVKCGCRTIEEFVEKMSRDSFTQFLLGLEFMKTTGIIKYLPRQDWVSFARVYNGSGYKANKYDEKLASAFKYFSSNPTKLA